MSTASPSVDTSGPFASWKFEHAAIRVPDFDAAVAWYNEKLDFRLIKSSPLGDKVYGFMTSPAVEISFMVELITGPGAENRPTYEDLASSLKLSGYHHVAFRVNSVDDAIAELKRRDVIIVSEAHDVPKLSLRVGFFADPWGNLFEVIHAIDV
jgi:catechol 2,3-dioxygenase-like lactoylglutathione lyase family enzyme